MIYLKFIPVILYLVEAFVPPLDGTNDTIDVQNSLIDKGTDDAGKIQLGIAVITKVHNNLYK